MFLYKRLNLTMLCILVGLFLAPLGPTASFASPFTNGGFESGPASAATSVMLSAGSPDLVGWTIEDGSIDYILTLWEDAEGIRSIDLNGNAPGTISQVFDTTPGLEYLVTFSLAGNPGPNAPPLVKELEVSAAGFSQEYSFDTESTTLINMGWQNETFSFIADSATTTLRFRSLAGLGAGPALDNVAFSAIPPLPSLAPFALATLTAVFGLVGWRKIRR